MTVIKILQLPHILSNLMELCARVSALHAAHLLVKEAFVAHWHSLNQKVFVNNELLILASANDVYLGSRPQILQRLL